VTTEIPDDHEFRQVWTDNKRLRTVDDTIEVARSGDRQAIETLYRILRHVAFPYDKHSPSKIIKRTAYGIVTFNISLKRFLAPISPCLRNCRFFAPFVLLADNVLPVK
jgi:hypothetical protein